MNDQRNLILAVVASIAILVFFHFEYEVPRAERMHQLELAEHHDQAGAQISGREDAPSADISAVDSKPVVPRADALTGQTRVKIANPRLYGSLPLKGNRIDDLTFTDYFTTIQHAAHVDLLSPSGTESPYFAVFGWLPSEAGTAVPDSNTVWKVDGDANAPLTPAHPVSFSWNNGHGLVFHRALSVDANYMFAVADSVTNSGSASVALVPYASVTRQGSPTPAATGDLGLESALGVFDGHLAAVGYGKLVGDKLTPEQATHTSTGGWLGFSDKYWLVAAIPDQGEAITAQFRHSREEGLDKFQADYRGTEKTVAPGATVTETTHLFAGAKQVDLLKAYRDSMGIPKLDLAVDWGFFWFLTKPFFYCIHFLAQHLGNFGLAILSFTVIMKVLVAPLMWKQFSTMARMGELTPKMTEIKEKHGTDKQTLQKELMSLYSSEGVNPLSGCVPLLLTIPIFISLFKVLSTTIEMRQAPFYWYIHDLSAPDPTNLFTLFGAIPSYTFLPHLGFLPLILGGTLFVLQLQAPKQADPLHNKMMLAQPLIFMFMMRSLPVGLVLYYILNNSISVVQQRVLRRIIKMRRTRRALAAAS